MSKPVLSTCEEPASMRLSPNIVVLGFVSLLTAVSSAMIYGLLPVFLVNVLGASIVSVGLIEGTAEAANSFTKIGSGAVSDWIGRRKPLVIFGYALSAVVKTLFPQAEVASTVFAARVLDRLGKGIRDAPRDALVADIAAPGMRGASFGLRLAVAITGFIFGPLFAVGLMRVSGDNFRLVFWVALIPAYLSIILLVLKVREVSFKYQMDEAPVAMRWWKARSLPTAFWRATLIGGLLTLARFSPAFLVLKANAAGVDAAFAPMLLGVMYLVYSSTAYPLGVLADRVDRRLQLSVGAMVLVGANVALAAGGTIWWVACGAALWGLQMGATQAALVAIIADEAPDHLRGAAFGIYDFSFGVAAFIASVGAGVLWAIGGPKWVFGTSACIAIGVGVLLQLSVVQGRSE
jgi:MFS family permease